MGSILRVLIARSIKQKGLRGGSPFWLAIGALSLVRRLYQRHGKSSEAITLGERIRPGDELIVRYPGKPGRGTRKEMRVDAKKKAEKAAALRARVDKVQAKADKGGFGARKARKLLVELTKEAR